MNVGYDWGDLTYFLAAARSGSALAAARALKVSQTTVVRRIEALEEALGLALFERRQAGYRLTDHGERLLPHAQAVEASARRFADEAGAAARSLAGTIRFTTNELIATLVLPALLRAFHEAHPDIVVETIASEDTLDLDSGEAEVAVRTALEQPQGPGLYVRKLATDPWVVGCSRDYAERHGRPQRVQDLSSHTALGLAAHPAAERGREWVLANAPGVRVQRSSSIPAMVAQVRAGLGVGAIPKSLVEEDSSLLHCFDLPAEWTPAVWLVTHERVRRVPRVRAFLDFLAANWAKAQPGA